MAHNIFKGLGIALITPFTLEGKVDYKSLRRLLDYQLANGADFLCILATTGEAPCLTKEEKEELTSFIKGVVGGRIPILKYCGGNNTAAVVDEIKTTDWTGIDGILSICPYYNKPSQDGLYQHFKAIAEVSPLPIVLYNVPGRTGQVMAPETILHLSQHKNIVAYKDAVGDIAHTLAVRNLVGDKIDIYSGNDDINVPIILAGGKGTISVLANVYPKATHEMCKYALERQVDKAFALQLKYLDFIHMLFAEPNPMPVKKCVELIGKSACHYRLPMTHVAPTLATKLEEEIARLSSLQGE